MSASAEVPISSHPQFAPALQTIVELVRRIMHADVASILSYSLKDKSVRWKAASGFTVPVDYAKPVFRPIGSALAWRAHDDDTVSIIQGMGTTAEFPAEQFPVHVAEGVCDMAIAPLRIVGKNSGALTAGFRTPHQFNEDEKRLLQDLAEMASVVLDSERMVQSVTAAETIWEQTFNAIGEGIVVHDSSGTILHCNAHAAEMMETDASNIVGGTLGEAFARMFGTRAADYYLAENHGASTMVEVQTETGRRYLVSVFPIKKPDGELVSVVTWSDVTRLSEMQDQLSRSRSLASVGQLAAGVAHEVNNPLAAITTCAEAVLRDLRKDEIGKLLPSDTQWQYYLEEIVRQALRCKEITRGLLDLTRQRTAKRTLCDINSITKQCARATLQRAAPLVEFEIKLDEGVGEIATDAAMVTQILDNLLINAVDAIGGQGKVTVTTRQQEGRIVIEIIDTGKGIHPDLLAKIFDPFFSTKGAGKGYGLGLAISSTMADSLRGGITVESKPGAGSTFRLWLPRQAPDI